jgi:membrane protease YdiL (CAAX protease family)
MTMENEPEEALMPEPVEPAEQRPLLPAAARVVLYLLAYVVLQSVLGAIALAAVIGTGSAMPRSDVELMEWLLRRPDFMAALFWGVLVVVLGLTLFFVRVLDRRPAASLGFAPRPAVSAQVAAGFGLGAALLATVFGVGWLLGWYDVTHVTSPVRAMGILAVALAILLPQSAGEEIVMRGYVFQALEARYGWRWALAVSAALFSLLHGLNPNVDWPALVGITVAGVYLGAAYLWTRRLWLPIAVHTAWNLFEGPVFGFPVSGIRMPASILHTETHGPELWTGGAFGPEAGLLLALALAAHLALLAWTTRPFHPESLKPQMNADERR